MKQLAQFDVRADKHGAFVLRLDDEQGAGVEFTASADQLDMIIEVLDEILDSHEEEVFELNDNEPETTGIARR